MGGGVGEGLGTREGGYWRVVGGGGVSATGQGRGVIGEGGKGKG